MVADGRTGAVHAWRAAACEALPAAAMRTSVHDQEEARFGHFPAPARLPLRVLLRAKRRSSLGTRVTRDVSYLLCICIYIRATSEFTGVVSWFAFSNLSNFLCKCLSLFAGLKNYN